MFRAMTIRAQVGIVKYVYRRLIAENMLLGKNEVARQLRAWADACERVGKLDAALELRYAADAFDTAEYVTGEKGDVTIVFRSLEKIDRERRQETALRKGNP